jgi:hypothetical protein
MHGKIFKTPPRQQFKDNLFMNCIEEQGQTIRFCGVATHQQNGIAKKRRRFTKKSNYTSTTCTKKMTRCNQHTSMDFCHQICK